MMIPTLSTDALRLRDALNRIERREQQRRARAARWQSVRARLDAWFWRWVGLPL